jgi:hypothetical protein
VQVTECQECVDEAAKSFIALKFKKKEFQKTCNRSERNLIVANLI